MKAATLLVAMALVLLLAGLALAEGSSYNLDWWTVDGGGAGLSSGEGCALGGTAGQPDAGVLEGDGYALTGGFWAGAMLAGRYTVYLPVVVRNPP